MSKKSFVKGAGILAISGLIVKVIGAIFRIPLMNTIGSEGMGLYQLAYPIYAFLLVASTAGLPVAISKMVSEEVALGNHYGAYRIFRISLRLLTILGIITSIILLISSGLISRIQGNTKSVYALMAISPALFFVSVMSAYRGYFQGMHIMYPTALSQIIEQLGKLIMGLTLATLWLPKGPEFGAAGAIVGVTLSEVAALVLLLGIYRRNKKDILKNARLTYRAYNQSSSRTLISRLIEIAVPVTIGASIMPLVNMIDGVIAVKRLAPIANQIAGIPYNMQSLISFATKEGVKLPGDLTMAKLPVLLPELYGDFTKMLATRMYGILTGGVNTLINFPAVLTIALAMSLVPAISESFALKDRRGVEEKTTMGIRLTLLVGVPSAVGLGVLAEPVLKVLYRMQDWEYAFGGMLLTTLSIGVIFLTLVQSLTAMLQGVGRLDVPVRNLLVGAIFKVVITYVLVANPKWNIKGAAVGTVVCYGIAATLNFIDVIKYTGIRFSLKDMIIKPIISVVVMGAVVFYIYNLVMGKIGNNKLALAISIVVGVVVYMFMLLATGSVTQKDFQHIPGGKKLGRILHGIGLLK